MLSPSITLVYMIGLPAYGYTVIRAWNLYLMGDRDAAMAWSLTSFGVVLLIFGWLTKLSHGYKSPIFWCSSAGVIYAFLAFDSMGYLFIHSAACFLLAGLYQRKLTAITKPADTWYRNGPIALPIIVMIAVTMVIEFASWSHTGSANQKSASGVTMRSSEGNSSAGSIVTTSTQDSYDVLIQYAEEMDSDYNVTGNEVSREKAFNAYKAAYEARYQSYETYESWDRRSRDKDQELAKLRLLLSDRYYFGDGVERDYSEALSGYEALAINESDAVSKVSCKNAARMHANGEGVARNLDMAIHYYSLCSPKYYTEIGDLYREDGQYREAVSYYMAARFSPSAKYWLGVLSYQGLTTPPSEGLRYAYYDEAYKYMLSAAKGGHSLAQARLAEFFLFGVGTKPDAAEATYWLSESEKSDNPYSLFVRGLMLWGEKDETGEVRKHEALQYIEKAAESGVKEASLRLAEYQIFESNDEELIQSGKERVFTEVEAGNPQAEFLAGLMYKEGAGVELDHQKSFEYMDAAASSAIPEAALEMRDFYQKGIYVQKSTLQANRWYSFWLGYNLNHEVE